MSLDIQKKLGTLTPNFESISPNFKQCSQSKILDSDQLRSQVRGRVQAVLAGLFPPSSSRLHPFWSFSQNYLPGVASLTKTYALGVKLAKLGGDIADLGWDGAIDRSLQAGSAVFQGLKTFYRSEHKIDGLLYFANHYLANSELYGKAAILLSEEMAQGLRRGDVLSGFLGSSVSGFEMFYDQGWKAVDGMGEVLRGQERIDTVQESVQLGKNMLKVGLIVLLFRLPLGRLGGRIAAAGTSSETAAVGTELALSRGYGQLAVYQGQSAQALVGVARVTGAVGVAASGDFVGDSPPSASSPAKLPQTPDPETGQGASDDFDYSVVEPTELDQEIFKKLPEILGKKEDPKAPVQNPDPYITRLPSLNDLWDNLLKPGGILSSNSKASQ